MRKIFWLTGLATAAAATAAGAQPATHEQHQATGQHPVAGQHDSATGAEKCCCEGMMHKMHEMMAEMMKMHQGVASHSGSDAKDKAQEQPKH